MKKPLGVALLIAALSFSPAHAVVIGFDDIPTPANTNTIPANYQGFTWSDTWTVSPGDLTAPF